MDATFCYTDLAGFPAISSVRREEPATDLVVRFIEMLETALGDADRLVRSAGDAAVIACPDPSAGVVFVSTLFELVASVPGFPQVRAGLHHAEELPDGDPGRLALDVSTGLAVTARAGQAMATHAVARAAERVGIEVADRGTFMFPGLPQPLSVFELDLRPDEGERVEDPVCRMQVERDRAPAHLRHNRVSYYFCSLTCAGDFARNPGRYTRG